MTTSNPIAVRKVLLEPDDPELRGAAPGSNATACTANEPPCRCRGSAQRDRFRTTSSDASHAPSRTISPPPSARSLLRFSWTTGLRAQSRQEHHTQRPGRATAMRPGAIVRVRTRFDVQRRMSVQMPDSPLCAGRASLPPSGRDRNAEGLEIRALQGSRHHARDARHEMRAGRPPGLITASRRCPGRCLRCGALRESALNCSADAGIVIAIAARSSVLFSVVLQGSALTFRVRGAGVVGWSGWRVVGLLVVVPSGSWSRRWRSLRPPRRRVRRCLGSGAALCRGGGAVRGWRRR
jgi:hypothetical protein